MIGTPEFFPPEWYEQRAYTQEGLTVWTLGCVLYVLLAGCPPFPSVSYIRSQNRIDTHPVMERLSAHAANLLCSMMHTSPTQRLKLSTIDAHPFWTAELPPDAIPEVIFTNSSFDSSHPDSLI